MAVVLVPWRKGGVGIEKRGCDYWVEFGLMSVGIEKEEMMKLEEKDEGVKRSWVFRLPTTLLAPLGHSFFITI